MPLVKYTGSEFLFDNPNYKPECVVDSDFVPLLDKKNEIAKKYGIGVYITSSFRLDSNHISGAVVIPATKSNHFVGCAIDENVLFDGVIYSHDELDDFVTLPVEVQKYIDECRVAGMRWGGNFKKRDSVHWDNGLNINNPELWEQKYKEYHT